MALSSYRIPFLIPYFVEMQRKSFLHFLNTGLISELSKKNPMYDSLKQFKIVFYPECYQLSLPNYTPKTAILKFKTYASKLYIPLRFTNYKTKQSKLQWVILANLPLMTKRGNFIINGAPRIIINQIVRSPGIYYKQVIDQKKQKTYYADLISQRGAWLRFEIDKKKRIWIQMKKTRKIPILIFFKAIGISNFKIKQTIKYYNFLENSKLQTQDIEKEDYYHPKTIKDSLFWIYTFVYPQKKKTSGISLKKAKKFLFRKFFSQRTYDLGYSGRIQLNKKFNLSVEKQRFILTCQDLLFAIDYLIKVEKNIGLVDDIDHLKNRKVRTCGELIQNIFGMGLIRLEKVINEKTENSNVCIFDLFTAKPIDSSLREFFGSSPLSQFMDQTNPLAELTHKRRISSIGPGGVSRETAGMDVRGIHPSHYGRICPIETPEGRNAGLVNSLTTLGKINYYGLIETPFFNVYKGQIQKWKSAAFLSPSQEQYSNIASGDLKINYFSFFSNYFIFAKHNSDFKKVFKTQIAYMCVSVIQMISIATSLIPFLEHDDANRALMGSNMQRQAVPLILAERPTVGTGLEGKIVSDSGHGIQSKISGKICCITSKNIMVTSFKSNSISSIDTTKFNNSKNNFFTHSDCIPSTQDFKTTNLQNYNTINSVPVFQSLHTAQSKFNFFFEKKQKKTKLFQVSNKKSEVLLNNFELKQYNCLNQYQNIKSKPLYFTFKYISFLIKKKFKLCAQPKKIRERVFKASLFGPKFSVLGQENCAEKNFYTNIYLSEMASFFIFKKMVNYLNINNKQGLHKWIGFTKSCFIKHPRQFCFLIFNTSLIDICPPATQLEFASKKNCNSSFFFKKIVGKTNRFFQPNKQQVAARFAHRPGPGLIFQSYAKKLRFFKYKIFKKNSISEALICLAEKNIFFSAKQIKASLFLNIKKSNNNSAILVRQKLRILKKQKMQALKTRTRVFLGCALRAQAFSNISVICPQKYKNLFTAKIFCTRIFNFVKNLKCFAQYFADQRLVNNFIFSTNIISLNFLKLSLFYSTANVKNCITIIFSYIKIRKKINFIKLKNLSQFLVASILTNQPTGFLYSHQRINFGFFYFHTMLPTQFFVFNKNFNIFKSHLQIENLFFYDIKKFIKNFFREFIKLIFLQIFIEQKNIKHIFFYTSLNWQNFNVQKFNKASFINNKNNQWKSFFKNKNFLGYLNSDYKHIRIKTLKTNYIQFKSKNFKLNYLKSANLKKNVFDKYIKKKLEKNLRAKRVTVLATKHTAIACNLDFLNIINLNTKISVASKKQLLHLNLKNNFPKIEKFSSNASKNFSKASLENFSCFFFNNKIILSSFNINNKKLVNKITKYFAAVFYIQELQIINRFNKTLITQTLQITKQSFAKKYKIFYNSNKKLKSSEALNPVRSHCMQTFCFPSKSFQKFKFLSTCLPIFSRLFTLKTNNRKKKLFTLYSSKKSKIVNLNLKSQFRYLTKITNYSILTYQHSNQNTCLNQTPLVSHGEWIQKGDLLGDGAASVGGELALGKSILVAYMPWEGYNFEDAILVSERLIYDDLYTSIHIEKYKVEIYDTQYGLEQITPNIPHVSCKQKAKLDSKGIIKIGSWVTAGDILVGKITPIQTKRISGHEKLLTDILEKKNSISAGRDTSLRVPKHVSGRIVHIEQLENDNTLLNKQKKQKLNVIQGPRLIHIYVAEKRKIQVGDKMSGRHGNKGIISNILPRQDMPYLSDGTPVDMVLNPLGVPSRMNVGQIFECLFGLASNILDEQIRISIFDEMSGVEATRSLAYSKLFDARLKTKKQWLFNPKSPGKLSLFDGRTGEIFHQNITVGNAYMLKLVHLVDEKIHARSTGPYSLVTQQPLRGRSKHGGQRLGEMEVWALEGFGAAYTLQELLTTKSDDIKGRHQVMQAILQRKSILLGTPESFKVLLSELQSLCLNIGVYSIDNCGIRKKIDIMQLS